MPAGKTHYKDRLNALRKAMNAQGVNGFIVPRADEYQGEYTAPYAERLSWLTGFTGTAGVAIVLSNKAAVMSDGRYTIQLGQQVDAKIFETANSVKTPIAEWLTNNAQGGDIIGYDPRLHTAFQIQTIETALEGRNIQLRAVDSNPVDEVWTDRPAPPKAKVEIFLDSIAGKSSTQKREEIAENLKNSGIFAAVITLPDSIAWLLNIRGGDVDYTPIALSYAFIDHEGAVTWFIDPDKISEGVRKILGSRVHIFALETLEEHLALLAAEAKKAGKPVGVDLRRSPAWFKRQLEIHGAAVKDYKDPCVLPKSLKTPAEQAAIRAAHLRDGVAMVNFLAWLDQEAPKGKLDEISVADKLEEFRRKDSSYRGPSFSTIAGFGANGAIVHYRADEKSNAKIKPPGLLLLDSGAQYVDGTTDITRTIAIGEPTAEMRRNFTLVLKGHIAVARARFPVGTVGAQIDALARQALWAEGLDYAHGTGHGVGCYLSVHEEAASISPRGQEPLKPGMLISNEPGYYKEGEYGIRIESLVLVKAGAGDMLEFETVTLAPIDRRLVDIELLNAEEKEWLNAYHRRVLSALESAGSLESQSLSLSWLKIQVSAF